MPCLDSSSRRYEATFHDFSNPVRETREQIREQLEVKVATIGFDECLPRHRLVERTSEP